MRFAAAGHEAARNTAATEHDIKTMSLTLREKEILDLVVNHGKINKEIADRLSLTEQTVKNYLRTALRHFGARRTRELFPIEQVKQEIRDCALPNRLDEGARCCRNGTSTAREDWRNEDRDTGDCTGRLGTGCSGHRLSPV